MLLKTKIHLSNQSGFTLFEILAVLLVISIVSAIAIPSVSEHIEVAKVTAEKESMIIVKNAVKRYLLFQPEVASMDPTTCRNAMTTEKYLDSMPSGITCQYDSATGTITVKGYSGNVPDMIGY